MGLADERREPWYNHQEQGKAIDRQASWSNARDAMAKWADSSNNFQGTFSQFTAGQGLTMGQITKGSGDSRSKSLSAAVDAMQKGVSEYSQKFPGYPSLQAVVSGLQNALETDHIRAGDPKWFAGKNNPFVTVKGVIYYNSQVNLRAFTPYLAHDGQHFVDKVFDSQFARERRAYDVQHGVSVVVGPYQPRLSDAQIVEILRQNP